MKDEILIYIGAMLPLLWGISHLIPTRSVVRGFGEISSDNKKIIMMEWITEGVALIFIGILVITVTIIDPLSKVSAATYIVSAICLIILAIVSLSTGFKINFLPFRLCPVIFTSSALLITIGWSMLK
jgi:hypothetical protein